MPTLKSLVEARNWRGLTRHLYGSPPERRLSRLARAVSEIERQIPDVAQRRRELSVVAWSEFLRILKEHPNEVSPRQLGHGIRILEGCLHRGECILEDIPPILDRFTQARPPNRSQFYRAATILDRVQHHFFSNQKTKEQAKRLLALLESRKRKS